MKPEKETIINSLLSGFQGVLFDSPDMLAYTIRKLIKRYLESHKDSGKKITTKTYLAALGALSTNSLMLDQQLQELEERIAKERGEKAAKKASKK